jgi:hypothetical protein
MAIESGVAGDPADAGADGTETPLARAAVWDAETRATPATTVTATLMIRMLLCSFDTRPVPERAQICQQDGYLTMKRRNRQELAQND